MAGRFSIDEEGKKNNVLEMEEIPFDNIKNVNILKQEKTQSTADQDEVVDKGAHRKEAPLNFMNKYALAFMRALENYTDAKPRIGYSFGWFSFIRHSFNQRKQFADNFKYLFFYANSNQAAKAFLEIYFTHNNTQYHHHSFSQYLSDELQTDFPDENWQCFNPYRIEFYSNQTNSNERLYFGCIVDRNQYFKNGIFDPNPSSSIDTYLSAFNYFGYGVVMTKSYSNASFVAKKPWQVPTHSGVFYNQIANTYVFEINYRGKKAIDVGKTYQIWEKSGGFFAAVSDPTDLHVTAIEHVSAKDIVGAHELFENKEPVWHANPNYQPNRQSKWLSQQSMFSELARRKAIFNDDHERLAKRREPETWSQTFKKLF